MENMGINPDFWKGKRVFLTGHTGFKGAWLSLWLKHLGAVVTGYALDPPTSPSLFEAAHVGRGMDSSIADVRDFDRLARIVKGFQPQVIIHMAAQSLVRESYASPLETYSTNVMGTANVLEAARKTDSIEAIVIVTTDKCYENREWLWGYREDEALGGFDPYSSSKACAELATRAYYQSFFAQKGKGVASVRAGNVIGGGDWAADRLLPDLARAFAQGAPAIIRNPDAVRPWQFVLDPLAGYLILAQKLAQEPEKFSLPFNFGPETASARPVRILADIAAAAWGKGAAWREEKDPKAPHEAHTLMLDSARARSLLNWRAKYDLATSVSKTLLWYKAFHQGQDAQKLTIDQIMEHQEIPCAL
ncbi:MAG: CDP-glucose 4,6-dehydratase [Desulfatibacillaceae bacterium]|nr:CDP-glucose 4,6-dehydratase [Desulfatibacillaceae bacterium]